MEKLIEEYEEFDSMSKEQQIIILKSYINKPIVLECNICFYTRRNILAMLVSSSITIFLCNKYF